MTVALACVQPQSQLQRLFVCFFKCTDKIGDISGNRSSQEQVTQNGNQGDLVTLNEANQLLALASYYLYRQKSDTSSHVIYSSVYF